MANVKAKNPVKNVWTYRGYYEPVLAHVYDHESGLRVLSALNTSQNGKEWHISISRQGPRGPQIPSLSEIDFVRESFGAQEFEEDSHGATMIVSLWLPVDKSKRGKCECKK